MTWVKFMSFFKDLVDLLEKCGITKMLAAVLAALIIWNGYLQIQVSHLKSSDIKILNETISSINKIDKRIQAVEFTVLKGRVPAESTTDDLSKLLNDLASKEVVVERDTASVLEHNKVPKK